MPTNSDMHWTVYLAGEIHSDWRQQIESRIAQRKLPVTLVSPVIDHDASDNCGVSILGGETDTFWKDHKSAGINSIRTRTHLQHCDIIVARFGPKYRQWNAAFDAGFAVALGKPLITLHDEDLDHAMKEVDAAASAVARTPDQVVQVLDYIITGTLHTGAVST